MCVEGTTLVDGHCVTCGPQRHAADGACVCDAGFAEDEAGECVPTGLGLACTPGGEPCPDAVYDTCLDAPGGAYCTRVGCTAEDCPAPYACDPRGAAPYCRRPPTGSGESCQSSEDCAGFEASYCETLQANACVVAQCETTGCFPGWECCDLTPFGLPTMCVPEGQCPV